MRGSELCYGQVVQLRHINTHQYLTTSQAVAKCEKANFRVELDRVGDTGSWWQVLPAYKFRSEGDKVRWDDAIVLVNAAAGGHHTGQYLHIAEAESHHGRGEGYSDSDPSRAPALALTLTLPYRRDPPLRGDVF